MKRTRMIILALCTPLVMAQHGFSQESANPEELLQRLTQVLEEADRYQIIMDSAMTMKASGQTHDVESEAVITVERPNRFRIQLRREDQNVTLSSDGDELVFYLEDSDKALKTGAPENLSDLFREQEYLVLFGAVAAEGMELLPLFLSENPHNTLMEDVQDLEYQGKESVNGRSAHVISGEQEEVDWKLWISVEDPVQVLKFVPDYTKSIEMVREQMPQMGDLEVSAETGFTDFRRGDEVDLPDFSPDLPEDVDIVDNLQELASRPAQAADALTGKTAPAFQLDRFEGGTYSFPEDHQDSILVLDFWASWCGPCVVALPALEEVTKEFEDRGVRFLAVNLRESKETVESFLDAKDLDVDVVMDEKGEVAELYRVSGIPQTVVIDSDGVIASVHIGYDPDIQQVLRNEFEEYLSTAE